MEQSRSVTVWSAGSLTVWARRTPARGLVLEGQDLAPGMPDVDEYEYEYAWPVQEDDVPGVLKALGADSAADPLDVLAERGAEVVRAGEGRWLRGHGIDVESRAAGAEHGDPGEGSDAARAAGKGCL